jgi:multiple sugar transport system permease protein
VAAMRTTMLGRTPYLVLTGGLAIIFLFPLLWSLVASVSPQASTGQVNGFGLGNYTTLYNYGAGLIRFSFNSAFVAVLTVVITIVVSTLGGYAFARFRFPGRDALFLLTLAILMVPYATLLIPLYVLLNRLGLQNSLVGLSLVLAMFQLPFATYMMRISFEAVPRELEESAVMDGCGTLAVLWRILLPSVHRG